MKIPVARTNDINLNRDTSLNAPGVRIPMNTLNTGDVISDVGKSVTSAGDMLEKAYSLAEKTKAQNILSTKIADVQARASADTDLSVEKQNKYHAEIDSAVRDSSSFISLQPNKDAFITDAQGDVGIAKIKIGNDFTKRKIDAAKADILVRQDELKNQYISATSDQEKINIILKDDALMQDMVNAGFTREQVAELKIKRATQWTSALAEHRMLNDPQGTKDELEKGTAGEYGTLPQDEIDKLIVRADSRMTVLDRLKKQQETVQKVSDTLNTVMDVANGKFNLDNPEEIRKVGLKNFELGEALQRVADQRGDYVPKDTENDSFQALAKDIFIHSVSQEDIANSLTRALAQTGKDISIDRLSILVDAASARAKTLGLSKDNNMADPIQSAISSGIKSILTNIIPPLNASNLIVNFLKGISSGKSPQDAHTEAVKSEVNRTNPLSVKYKVGDIVTNSKGEAAEITGFNETGSPIIKRKVSGKQPSGALAK